MKEIDTEKIESAVHEILVALNDDPEREGLKDTPQRVAKMFAEVYEGMCYTNDELVQMYGKTFTETVSDDMVVVKNIPVYSHCEHHLALMYDMEVSVAYVPHGKVIGLSKIARIADMVGKRLQLQERIGVDIAYILQKILDTDDVAVQISGKHACMTTRGIKKESVTSTSVLRGVFKANPVVHSQMMNAMN